MLIRAKLSQDDDNQIELRFGYNKALVEKIKSLPSRQWNNDKKCWTIPLAGLNKLSKIHKQIDLHESILQRIEEKRAEIQMIKEIKDLEAVDITIHGLKLELRPFQTVGVYFLNTIQRGILAFDTGLGKSVTAISQIINLKQDGKVNPIRKVLIIVPASLKRSWYSEFKKFTALKPLIIGAEYNKDGDYKELKKKDREAQYENDVDDAEIIIINFELLVRDIKHLQEIPFVATIIDEAQRIKGVQGKTTNIIKKHFRTPYRYLLSASPMENGLEELWSLIDYVNPGLFGSYWQFRGDHMELGYFKEVIGYKDVKRFSEKANQVMFRLNKKDVLKDLPPLTKQVIYIPLSTKQRKEYDNLRKKVMAEAVEKLTKLGDRAATEGRGTVMNTVLALSRFVDFPGLIGDYLKEIESSKCKETIALLDSLMEQERKVIIFNRWTKSIAMLKAAIEEHNIEREKNKKPPIIVHQYHGDCKTTREDDKIAFQNSDHTHVMLMSTAGSVGLNLQEADCMIFYNITYNPLQNMQTLSRIYRMGQDSPVHIYYMATENTVEEKIYKINEKKQALFDEVVEQDDIGDVLDDYSVDEIMEILKK